MGGSRSPARQQGRVAIERPKRTGDKVVEVDRAGRRERSLVGHECESDGAGLGVPSNLVGGHTEVELEPGEGVVKAATGPGVGIRGDLAQQTVAGYEGRGAAGVAEDLEPEGVEGANADGVGRDAERLERRRHPLAELLGGAGIERNRGDRRRVGSGRNEPRDSRHKGGGLAGARRRDAQHRAGRRGGRGTLVGRESGEPLRHRRGQVGRGERMCGHDGSLTTAASRRLTRQSPRRLRENWDLRPWLGKGAGATVEACSSVRSAERERVGVVSTRALTSDLRTRIVRVIVAGGAQCGSTNEPRSC